LDMNDLPLLYAAPMRWEPNDARPPLPAGAKIRARGKRRAHRGAGPRGGPRSSENYHLELRGEFPLARIPRRFEARSLNAVVWPSTYWISTLAPASSNFFLMAAASSLFTPSLMVLGAPSTRSLASFRPRLVTSRTALMTLILFPPTSVRT